MRALAAEVIGHDGGRLKLELGYVESARPEAALAYARDRLVGFAAVYAFSGGEPEIAGMVAPSVRRQGVGTALLDSLLPSLTAHSALLVTPTGSEAGRAFAELRGAKKAHSEHFMVLAATPAEPVATVGLRLATGDDIPTIKRVVSAAFGTEHSGVGTDRGGDTTYVIEKAGGIVGTVRLSVGRDWGGVYGFAVDPAYQGQGIGREVLARACRMLRADGRSRVTLEVETENDNALRLYTSIGFVREAGEDYWRVEL